jgi:hypothetical protein
MSHSTPTATDTITRVLHLAPKAHIYAIPPLRSAKGHIAATWTKPPAEHIFTARIRILETSPPSSAPPDTKPSVTLLLEDPITGDLFAQCPYTDPSAVEAALDSTRFFAIRVVGEGRQKAVLGMGFEERAEAFDFGVSLQEVRKVMGIDSDGKSTPGAAQGSKGTAAAEKGSGVKRDFSLKEGQMLVVYIGKGKGFSKSSSEDESRIPPPSGGMGGGFGFLPPPPSAQAVRAERRRSRPLDEGDPQVKSLKDMGFDDGEFGEFQ